MPGDIGVFIYESAILNCGKRSRVFGVTESGTVGLTGTFTVVPVGVTAASCGHRNCPLLGPRLGMCPISPSPAS